VRVAEEPGKDFLKRYYVLKSPVLSVYIHQILRSDEADMHDHPWPFLVVILRQGYREVMAHATKIRRPLEVFCHLPSCAHRIELIDDKPSWSLVVMGPKLREWGFHTKAGWVHFKKYLNKQFSKGCD
jgi:hypothetical protein